MVEQVTPLPSADADDGRGNWVDDHELVKAYATKSWLPDGLTLTKVTLALPTTTSLFAGEAPHATEVVGYVSEDIPGLAVSRESSRDGWAVTHLESGRRLPGSTPYDVVTALVIAGFCGRLTDWRSIHFVDGSPVHDELDDESFKAVRDVCKSGIAALVETFDDFTSRLDDVVELLNVYGYPVEVA